MAAIFIKNHTHTNEDWLGGNPSVCCIY